MSEVFYTKAQLVESYHEKETFGDMDILVYDNGLSPEKIKKLISKFKPGEIQRTRNNNVYTFDYKNLQIDLIFVSPENWEASKIFYQWGDLGNLMGKLFNTYGDLNLNGYALKYGFDGVKIKMIHETYKEEFYLTKDNRKMFDFLGLNFRFFEAGFNNEEEMYNYVIGSKYFNSEIFQWENLISVKKKRNKTRPGYYKFLEYIKNRSGNKIEWNEGTEYYLNVLNEFFGVNIQEEKSKLIARVDRIKSIRNKFSGKQVIEEFGIKGKDLGKLMGNFRDYIENKYEDYDDFILENDYDEILKIFKEVNKLK